MNKEQSIKDVVRFLTPEVCDTPAGILAIQGMSRMTHPELEALLIVLGKFSASVRKGG